MVHADVDEQEQSRAKMLKQVCRSLAAKPNGTRPPDDEHACGHKRHNTVLDGDWPVHHNLLCNEAKRLRTRAVNAEAEASPLYHAHTGLKLLSRSNVSSNNSHRRQNLASRESDCNELDIHVEIILNLDLNTCLWKSTVSPNDLNSK